MQKHCDDDASVMLLMLLLVYPVKATRCGAAALFIQYITEKQINAEKMMFTSKLNRAFHTEFILSPLHLMFLIMLCDWLSFLSHIILLL